MGVHTPTQFSYRTKIPLEWQQILYLVQPKFISVVINIDANNVAYNFMNEATTSVGKILQLVQSLSKSDAKCEVYVITDGDTKYNTK